MNNKYLDEIISNLNETFKTLNLKPSEDAPGVFLNDKKAVLIEYNEKQKLFDIKIADIEDGSPVDFKSYSSWLFDESHDSRDAKSIAIDFENTLKSEFGIKTASSRSARDVALPTKNSGDNPNIDAFAEKFFKLFPEYKEDYKNHIIKYGEFMYVDFFMKTAAVKLLELVKAGNKNKLKKMFDMLGEFYVNGDSKVGDTIVVAIIGKAFGSDIELFNSVEDYMDDYTHLRTAGRAIIHHIKKNKKLKDALDKAV